MVIYGGETPFDNAWMADRVQHLASNATERRLLTRSAEAVPPHVWFGVSAVFHYLGPSFAVLLFPVVGVLGVAWFRIAAAALIFAPLTRPWHTFREAGRRECILLLALGGTLAVMNSAFYLALDRLPIALVATIEFVGTIGVALWGLRTARNWVALVLALSGVGLLLDIPSLFATGGHALYSDLSGLFWAVLNGALFVLYIFLGHRISGAGASGGVERLGAAMAAGFLFIMPIGLVQAVHAFGSPLAVLAGIGVGFCSSVIPYVTDQLAMSRLPRSSFALLLALLPAIATVMGVIVLRQIPSIIDGVGVALVMLGVAIHKPLQQAP